ncbi:phosphinothricin acetyltransferase [Psychromicrobium silvestre]|uniref:Phosphinothricin acetyltransferase n=1 Tax=Psychromicrobium silvestre TaxID=1645614 RepID=A0A7Y9S6T1_9MICC|nr:phosphinothricin acetyltransferase [Psychromicrobium silvestre]
MKIRLFDESDWSDVTRIYAAGVSAGNATFDAELPAREAYFASRVPELRLAAFDDGGQMLGWTAASRTSARAVYRGVVEHSVYIDPKFAGQGVAGSLLAALSLAALEHGYWTIQSSIFPENAASRALHEKNGFRLVGRRERVGLMSFGPHAGQWRDTLLYEKRL